MPRPLTLVLAAALAATTARPVVAARSLVLFDLEAPRVARDLPRPARREAWIRAAQELTRRARAALPAGALEADGVEELWAIRGLRVTAMPAQLARIARAPGAPRDGHQGRAGADHLGTGAHGRARDLAALRPAR
jgi:hypothetical protein